MAIFVILLRAIGPVTHKIMSMADWRAAMEKAGYKSPQTYLATGNMILESPKRLAEVEVEANAIVQRLGLGKNNIAVVRSPEVLDRLVKADPFPQASLDHPSQMGVYFFANSRPDLSWTNDYEGRERLAVVEDHLIVDYRGGISESPKLPGIIEKQSGAATARNWNTLRGLARLAAARGKDH